MMKRKNTLIFSVMVALSVTITLLIVVRSRQSNHASNNHGAAIVPASRSPNLLVNPGFEQGETAWQWLSWSQEWAPFSVRAERYHSGRQAAYLPVRSQRDGRQTVIWGVVQDVKIGQEFPSCLQGWYLVAQWRRGAAKQYLQAILLPQLKPSGPMPQIRMILTGINQPSYNLANARVFFVDPQRSLTPPVGKWIHFHCPVAEWFQKAWGFLPPAGTSLRVFFEARFDDRAPGAEEPVADVWFDDLYLGSC